jgi:DNA polymerase I-like protein with 3'-5' exonuclease and polymerase domains
MVEKIIESYDSRLVAAFTAGEELGHRNAKSIYRFTRPEEEVSQAASRYAKSI